MSKLSMDVYSPFKGAKVFSPSATHFQPVINYYALRLSEALREYIKRKDDGTPWIPFMQRFQLELDFALAQIGIAYAQGSTPEIPWILRSIASYRRHMADTSILDLNPDLLIALGRPPDFTELDPFLIPVALYHQSWWCSPMSMDTFADVVCTATLPAAMEFHKQQVHELRSKLLPKSALPFKRSDQKSSIAPDADFSTSTDTCPKCAERQQALSAVRNGYAELLLHVNAIQDFITTSAKESEAQVQAHFLLSALYTSLQRPPTIDDLRKFSLAYHGRVPEGESQSAKASEADNLRDSVDPSEEGGYKFPIPSFNPEADSHCNVDLSITNLTLNQSARPYVTPPLSMLDTSAPSAPPRQKGVRLNPLNAEKDDAMESVEEWVCKMLESREHHSTIGQQELKDNLVFEITPKRKSRTHIKGPQSVDDTDLDSFSTRSS